MTLTQTAILTKQVIIISTIALFLSLASFVGYKVWYNYYLSTLPPVEEKPDTKFGVLPPPDFPQINVSSSNFSYSLDTTTGFLPKLGDEGFEKIIKVYFIIKPYATLLSGERSQTLSEKFLIKNPPEILNDTTYRFKEKDKTLTVDLDSGNFTYTNEATKAAEPGLDDDNSLVTAFKTTLNNLGALKPELNEGRTKIVLLKIEGGNFIPTQLRTETVAAEVSLWPKALDKKPIFTSDFNKSPINATIVNSASNIENYLSLDFTYWQVDEKTYATYPTKNPEDALSDLKEGKGVIILEPSKPQVSITSVYIGYFLPNQYNQYLQPVYVFEGPQFVAYVSAVSKDFIEAAK